MTRRGAIVIAALLVLALVSMAAMIVLVLFKEYQMSTLSASIACIFLSAAVYLEVYLKRG